VRRCGAAPTCTPERNYTLKAMTTPIHTPPAVTDHLQMEMQARQMRAAFVAQLLKTLQARLADRLAGFGQARTRA